MTGFISCICRTRVEYSSMFEQSHCTSLCRSKTLRPTPDLCSLGESRRSRSGCRPSSSLATPRTLRHAGSTRAIGPWRGAPPIHRDKSSVAYRSGASISGTPPAWLPRPAGRTRSAAAVFFEHESRSVQCAADARRRAPLRAIHPSVIFPIQLGQRAVAATPRHPRRGPTDRRLWWSERSLKTRKAAPRWCETRA